MKLKHCLLFLSALPFVILNAQISIPVSGEVLENFNFIGNTPPSALPAHWKMSSAGTGLTSGWATGTNVTDANLAASSGTPPTGGRYNWGTMAGTDRSIGFMTDGSYASPNAIMAYYRNTTGATVTSITVSFQVERYRVNSDPFYLSFFSSADGSVWTARNGGDISGGVFPTGSSAYHFSSPQTVVKTVTITGLNIVNNGDFYLKWVFHTGVNSQGMGLDEVVVMAGAGAPGISATLEDQLANDVNSNNQANEGDGLRYKATIKNIGTDTAKNVQYNNPTPDNTTFVPGSVKTSALARDDQFSTGFNIVLNGSNVLTNDFGLPSLAVVSFGPSSNSAATTAGNTGTTDNGGTITLNADGTFTYIPPANFNGYDRFSYIASTLPGGTLPNNDATVTIAVGSPATAAADSYNAIGNVSINPNSTQGVLNNDAGSGSTVVAVNGDPTKVGTATLTTQNGNITLNADGSFSYNPPAGFEGTDQFSYSIDNGFSSPSTVTVSITVSGMIWFINNGGAAGDGRLSSPFNSVAAFQAVNNGSGNNPAAGDHIFVYEHASAYTPAAITLLQNQKLIGQDATASLQTITGYSVPTYSAALPVNNTGGNTVSLTNTATIITLSTAGGNLVRGMTLMPSAGSGLLLSGVASGNHTATDLVINASGTANGFSLATTSYGGTFNYTSGSIASSGTGTAFNVSGNTATITASVNISQTGSGSLVSIVNHATGTITFQTGTLSANNGNGLQFSNADGTYNFNGTTTLAGGDAGVDILNGSAGSFVFSANTSITSPSGTAFNVDGISAANTGNISYAGSINQGTSGQRWINISTYNTGTITFSGAAANYTGATGSTGVHLNAVNGNVTFTNGLTAGSSGSRMTQTPLTISGGTGTYNFNVLNLYTNSATAMNVSAADGTINSTSGVVDATGAAALILSGASAANTLTLGLTLTTVNSSGGTNNVSIINGAGTAALGTGALSGASGTAFNIGSGVAGSGGTATISYAGSLNKTSAGRLAEIQNRTANNVTLSGSLSSTGSSTGINITNNSGGIIEFSGGSKTFSTATNAAITLTNNTGATINFTGGGLAITTTSGNGFSATGGGTVNITGANNVVNSTTGTAVNIQNTTIGANGIIWRSVSANGGANGIVLSNTGNNSFTVTGDGLTRFTGGTIQNSIGSDGAVAGNGVYLNNANNVALNFMQFNGHQNNGILGSGLTNLLINQLQFNGNNGNSNSGSFEESPIQLVNSGGAITVQNTRLDGGSWNGFLIRNTIAPTTPLSLTLSSDTVSSMQGSTMDVRNTGLQAILSNGNATVNVNNNQISYWWGNAIQVVINGTASATANITANICSNTSGALAGSGGINVSGGALNYTISNNNIQNVNGTAISADKGSFNKFMTGQISGNIIGTSGLTNSGSTAGTGIFASHTGSNETRVKISNNIIRQINGSQAIWVLVGDDVGGGGSGTMNATIVGNDIQEAGSTLNSGRMGILITNGRVSGDTDIGCFDIGGAGALANSITNFNIAAGGSSVNRVRINLRFLTTSRFPGYTGASNDDNAMGAYLMSRNTISNYINSNNVSAGGSGYTNTPGGAACPQ